jgi:hypothetical protein
MHERNDELMITETMKQLSLEQAASNYSNALSIDDFETGSPWDVAQTKPRQEAPAVMLSLLGREISVGIAANTLSRL